MPLRHEKPLFPGNARVSTQNTVLPVRASQGFTRLLAVLALAITLGCSGENPWHVEEVTGHLPDLDFSLTSDRGSPVTANEFEGKLLLLYFGYTRCNAECPVSLARLARIMQMLGDGKNQVRILFVSLDPDRDTPEVLRRYIAQFDSEGAVGLTGTAADIERLTKQYRTAYRSRSRISETAGIEHGDAVYIFDAQRRARLLATSSDTDEYLMKDLRRLAQEAYQERRLGERAGDREHLPRPD